MHTTRVLANYVHGLRADALSAQARDAAQRCLLDLLGAAVAGYSAPAVQGMRRVARTLYGQGRAPIWFSGDTLNSAGAALINSAAASALDLDDGNRVARGHPGAAVIPVALAVAAEVGACADDVLTAIVAGYETGVRVATARNAAAATVSRQSGRWTGYAAVAAAAWLRKTPPEQMSHAFAIAGVTAPNQEANGSSGYSRLTGNDVKEGIAWSAAAGITALHMAETGLTGPEDILDHESHFSSSHLLDGLGERPLICDTYFKPYSCCRYNHAAMDAFAAVVVQQGLAAEDMVTVDVYTFGWALQLGNKVAPQNLVDVQYSIPYCIGVAAIMGAEALLPVDMDVLHRADITAFARKVTLHEDSAMSARFPAETLARVVITTRVGVFESPVTTPRGEASNPMSMQDLREKFRAATRKIIGKEQQQSIGLAVELLAAGEIQPLLMLLARPLNVIS
jgi:2-methylcitrate dehydratase PrpD